MDGWGKSVWKGQRLRRRRSIHAMHEYHDTSFRSTSKQPIVALLRCRDGHSLRCHDSQDDFRYHATSAITSPSPHRLRRRSSSAQHASISHVRALIVSDRLTHAYIPLQSSHDRAGRWPRRLAHTGHLTVVGASCSSWVRRKAKAKFDATAFSPYRSQPWTCTHTPRPSCRL